MGPDHFWGGWWMFPMVMPVFMLVVIVVVLYFIFGRGGFRQPWGGRYPGKDSETALDILKKRYARGELKKEEFEQMKKDLSD